MSKTLLFCHVHRYTFTDWKKLVALGEIISTLGAAWGVFTHTGEVFHTLMARGNHQALASFST